MLFGWIGRRLTRGLRSGTPFQGYPSHREAAGPFRSRAADGYASPKAPCHPAFRASDCLQPDVHDNGHPEKIIILAEISNNQQYE